MKPVILLLSSFLLTSCATNHFAEFYRDNTSGVPQHTLSAQLYPYSGSTQILPTKDHDADAENIAARGYACIGTSSFEGAASVTEQQLKQQAAKVGADIVLYGTAYLGAEQGAVPLLQYHPGQTYTTTSYGTVQANAYGSGGYGSATANYSGTSTTTSPGSFSTQMVPRTFHRYSHAATFWRKSKPGVLGVRIEVLPNSIREQLGRNTGALVTLVMIDGPAFRANLLKGDIITHIGDVEIASPEDGIKRLQQLAGQKVNVRVLRKGAPLDVAVQLNPLT